MSTTYLNLVEKAKELSVAYYDGAAELATDGEFENILRLISEHEKAHPDDIVEHGLFTQVAAGVSAGGDIAHDVPMLSLEKAKPEEWDVVWKWLDRMVEASGEDGVDVRIEPKLDGMAVSVHYEDGLPVRALSRGDGVTGTDYSDRLVNDPLLSIVGLPHLIEGFTGELRGEVLMSHDDYTTTNRNRQESKQTLYNKPRNATTGVVRASVLKNVSHLHFVTYDVIGDATLLNDLVKSKEIIPSSKWSKIFGSNEPANIQEYIERFGDDREEFDFPIDGMVLKVTDRALRRRLGASSKSPRWAIAYKFPPLEKRAFLRDIVVDVKRTGNVSFTAVFHDGESLEEQFAELGYTHNPIILDGSKVDHASVHNPDIIRQLTEDGEFPHIGDEIWVYLANEIIPQVVKGSAVRSEFSEADAWTPPTADADGYPFDTSYTIWRSTNPESNLGALLVYAASRKALDIDTLGAGVAAMLVGSGVVADIADLFTLDATIADLPFKVKPLEGFAVGEDDFDYGNPDDFRFEVEKFGEKRAETLLANISGARQQPFARFITALGIRSVGGTFGRRIAKEVHTFDALLALKPDDMRGIEGIAAENKGKSDRATLFYEGFQANRAVIEKFSEVGITFDEPVVDADAAPGVLDGLTVVMTGSTKGTALAAYSRDEMKELVEKHGGRASGSVSKNTNLLVAGEGAGSKIAAAEKNGVEIITPDEFAERLGLV